MSRLTYKHAKKVYIVVVHVMSNNAHRSTNHMCQYSCSNGLGLMY